ncbi:hypothetical protein B0H17DRAFT_332957 [Mycena rosella]|uniref:Uncharacterized protein n=1 Tax=Mycena rosella TaxID=1033263 RepID=A0AAD7GJU1_MYCRO|nr:hypothetical protein B0H17DRAFT_332957 [Mycena rosella]
MSPRSSVSFVCTARRHLVAGGGSGGTRGLGRVRRRMWLEHHQHHRPLRSLSLGDHPCPFRRRDRASVRYDPVLILHARRVQAGRDDSRPAACDAPPPATHGLMCASDGRREGACCTRSSIPFSATFIWSWRERWHGNAPSAAPTTNVARASPLGLLRHRLCAFSDVPAAPPPLLRGLRCRTDTSPAHYSIPTVFLRSSSLRGTTSASQPAAGSAPWSADSDGRRLSLRGGGELVSERSCRGSGERNAAMQIPHLHRGVPRFVRPFLARDLVGVRIPGQRVPRPPATSRPYLRRRRAEDELDGRERGARISRPSRPRIPAR